MKAPLASAAPSDSRRILFVTQTYPRHPTDGAAPFIRDLARGLVRGGDQVTVLTPHAAGLAAGWDDGGVAVRTFRYAPEAYELVGYGRSLEADEGLRLGAAVAAPLYLLGVRRACAKLLAEERWDLVHAHWVVPNGVAVAGVVARRRVPLAIGLHGSDVFLAEKPLVRSWVGSALGRSGVLTGCSPELVERVARLGMPSERCRVIPYGVDGALFQPLSQAADGGADRQRWRQRLGVPHDAVLVLGVGRMATKKGFHVLVEALPELLAELPQLHVVLAGAGDRRDELIARTASWRSRVHFPGAVFHDELPGLYRAADVFCLPAVHDRKGNVDGLPNVILEAMASGLPVVASGISGIPLAIHHGREGLLVEEADPRSLAAALRQLAEQPDLRREMGQAARSRVEGELGWDQVARRYRAAYELAWAADELPSRNG